MSSFKVRLVVIFLLFFGNAIVQGLQGGEHNVSSPDKNI